MGAEEAPQVCLGPHEEVIHPPSRAARGRPSGHSQASQSRLGSYLAKDRTKTPAP